ncbi:MAG: DNA double-strand break repair Rad50 ATPase [Methanosaeta sp. PtaU1.Bin112]|nr:MAG: DNA double-strand break repair Rad50 ATPase [Methanosaeta sp. PtaU1.Bin112]
MHLDKLIMNNFKKFRHAELEFSDGLTGIVGSNGSGKSTIVEAIAWALYGNRASAIKRDFIRNARARESDTVEARLTLSLGKQELVIYRAMKGKGLLAEAFLMLDGRTIASGSKEVDGRLEEILNISYQDFMKTFYARQKDLDSLLKEGGMGKREYLLKLLGLEDIKDNAMLQIREDQKTLEEKKSWLAGALAEMRDVDLRLNEASCQILSGEKELNEAERSRESFQQAAESRRRELEAMAEKKHQHDLLDGKIRNLEAADRQLQESARAEEQRLLQIDACRKRLSDLQRNLDRLACIRNQLEVLLPKRAAYEEAARLIAAQQAAIQGEKKALAESRRSLLELEEGAKMLDELQPKEKEHSDLQVRLCSLEALRDRHNEMQSRLKEDAIRERAVAASLSRTKKMIDDLHIAEARLKEIQRCPEEEKSCRTRQQEHLRQRDLQKELDGLLAQRKSLDEKLARLKGEAERARAEMEGLQNIEEREEGLRRQDKDLDQLVSELNSVLAELRGSYRMQELSRAEAERSLKKVMALGEEGVCPTCERPLEGQRNLLISKYEDSAAIAKAEMEKLAAGISAQTGKIEGATRSRSNLRAAFELLNSQKSRRSALQAELRGLAMQMHDLQSEIRDLKSKIDGLGSVSFDAESLAQTEAALLALRPLVMEHAALSRRLQDLPALYSEMAGQEKEVTAIAKRQALLKGEIETLGYSEPDFQQARTRMAIIKPLHERYLSLSERVAQMPAIAERMNRQEQEIQSLNQSLQLLQASQRDLGYDPQEYESLSREKRELGTAEKEAQTICLTMAGEAESRERLATAKAARQKLSSDLLECRQNLAALAYSLQEHEKAKANLAGAEAQLEAARKTVSDRQVRMGVLRAARERLMQEAQRKELLEKKSQEVGRSLEVVEVTRNLFSSFMDQVLIRVKNDIARSAGEILEEVSGKYSLIKIDDDFNIQVEDGGEWYPISRYSGGEIDMIAVSVRVAISEYLMRFGPDGESYSFLILDEVFGSQDQEHREKMIQMLRSLEERFPQIIAISHISDVQGQFDNTLLVAEDEQGNSRVEAI